MAISQGSSNGERVTFPEDYGERFRKLPLNRRRIVELSAQGRTAAEIAGMLHVAKKTVEAYQAEIASDLPGPGKVAAKIHALYGGWAAGSSTQGKDIRNP